MFVLGVLLEHTHPHPSVLRAQRSVNQVCATTGSSPLLGMCEMATSSGLCLAALCYHSELTDLSCYPQTLHEGIS